MTQRTIYRAELDTRHFHFEAFGDTQSDALGALISGLERHAIAYKLDSGWMLEVVREVTATPLALGACYRDQEKL